jgi:hypothetical protein
MPPLSLYFTRIFKFPVPLQNYLALLKRQLFCLNFLWLSCHSIRWLWHSCGYHHLLQEYHTTHHTLHFSSTLKISVNNLCWSVYPFFWAPLYVSSKNRYRKIIQAWLWQHFQELQGLNIWNCNDRLTGVTTQNISMPTYIYSILTDVPHVYTHSLSLTHTHTHTHTQTEARALTFIVLDKYEMWFDWGNTHCTET